MGARVAQGQFLVFLDADCFIRDPDSFFKTAIYNFDRVSNLVALTGLLRVLPESETISDEVITGSDILMVKVGECLISSRPSGGFANRVEGKECQPLDG